jgi:hypothetical protein
MNHYQTIYNKKSDTPHNKFKNSNIFSLTKRNNNTTTIIKKSNVCLQLMKNNHMNTIHQIIQCTLKMHVLKYHH